MSVELKILVSYDEYELLKATAEQHESCKNESNAELNRLKKIEQDHKNCPKQSSDTEKNNLSTAGGSGVCPDASGDYINKTKCFVMPKVDCDNQKNVDDSKEHCEKLVIVDKATEVSPNHSPFTSLSESDVIQHIKENFKPQAKELLQKLNAFPEDFSYDSNGILRLFGTVYPGNFKSLF